MVCVSVWLLVTFVSPAKTAEPIEMPFGWMTRVGPKNHAVYGNLDSLFEEEGAILWVVPAH